MSHQLNVDLTPKNNFIFKKLFTHPKSRSYLIDFLKAVLNEDILDVSFVESESESLGNYYDSKNFRFDLKVILSDGRVINVEMQKENVEPIEKRLTSYVSRLASEQLKQGQKYDTLKDTVVICILNYNFTNLPEYHTETITVAKLHREYELANFIKYHFIELPKFRQSKPDLSNKLDQWLLFLDSFDKELVDMAAYKNEEIKKAREIYEFLTANPNIRNIIDDIEWAEIEENSRRHYAETQGMEKGLKEGLEKGLEQGLEKGKKEKQIEIAKELLKSNMNIDQIVQITKLSKKELQKLK